MSEKEQIKALLKLGYTYRMLADICDVHHTTLSNWCNRENNLSPRLLERIHNGLKEHKLKINDILNNL